MYDNGGGARILDEYLHEFGREEVGEGDLGLLTCTESESTTNFSIRDCLLANSAAPFPAIVEPSLPRLIPLFATGETGNVFDELAYDFPACGGKEAMEFGVLSNLFLDGEGWYCWLVGLAL